MAEFLSEVDTYRVELLARLAEQPEALEVLVRRIPAPEWHWRRSPAGSTLHQIVAHMRDLEVLAFLPRFRRVLTDDRPRLEPFRSHHWSAEAYDPAEPMDGLLAAFAQARAEMVRLAAGMRPEDWNRVGFHPPSGWRTAQWWAERIYTHAMGHMQEIRDAV